MVAVNTIIYFTLINGIFTSTVTHTVRVRSKFYKGSSLWKYLMTIWEGHFVHGQYGFPNI